jgi:hypothetical protein
MPHAPDYCAGFALYIALGGMEDRRSTLWGTARQHWRSFAPAWVLPLVFLYGGLACENLGQPQLFFFLVAAPLFFWCFFRSTRPNRKSSIPYSHWVFWGVLVPFGVWSVAVLANLAVTGRLHVA